jgi:hypothetical protein
MCIMQERASTSCARVLLFSLFALLLGALLRSATAQEGTSPRQFKLTGPDSSFLLAKEYPKSGLHLDFTVRYEKPGMVFDTVGLNVAPAGAWTVVIIPDGRLTVQVFDKGWHLLTSAQKLSAGQSHRVVLDFTGAAIVLRVGAAAAQTLKLATPLSGQPVWVGDFPGDDGWGPRYNIHPAFTGNLTVLHFGAPPPDAATSPSPGATPSRPAAPPAAVIPALSKLAGTKAIYRSTLANVYMTATFTPTGVSVVCESPDGQGRRTFEGALTARPGRPDIIAGHAPYAGETPGEVKFSYDTGGEWANTLWFPKGRDVQWTRWVRVSAVGQGDEK